MHILEQLKKAAQTAPKERGTSSKVETGTSSNGSKVFQDPYFSDTGTLSNSMLKGLRKDGTKAEGYAPAYRFGSLSDAYMTEPFLYEHTNDATDFERLQIFKQWHALSNHKEARELIGEEYFDYINFSHNFKGDELPSNYKPHYKGKGFELQRPQYGHYNWKGKKIKFRGKFDILNKDTKVIIDLKTTTKQNRRDIIRSANNMNYWTQPELYTSIYSQATDFVFIFITYASVEMLEKATMGNKEMMKAIVEPSQVHIVRWSQLGKEKLLAKRAIDTQLELVQKYQPHLLQ